MSTVHFSNGNNPIYSVGNNTNIPCPSYYRWKLQDISESDAGRTENAVMDKQRMGQIVALELKWQNVSIANAATILQAFNPEYITVCYLDAKKGDYETSKFYVGDRNVPLYNSAKGVWSEIAFNIIQRNGKEHYKV